MRVQGKRNLKILSAAVLMLLVFALAFFCFAPNVADAVLPAKYEQDVLQIAHGEWWTSALNFSTVESAVKSWKASPMFDFEYLEKNPVVIAVLDTGINTKHALFEGKYDQSGEPLQSACDDGGDVAYADEIYVQDSGADDVEIGDYDVYLRDKNGALVAKNTAKYDNGVVYDEKNISDTADNKHGTHVTGIIALLIHKLDLEKYIKILPVKAANTTMFTAKAIEDGIDFALANGADVVNMSLASDSQTFSTMMTSRASKSVFVAAAGNSSQNSLSKVYYPAGHDGVIGVMNHQRKNLLGNYTLSDSSNFGKRYDLCAPGFEIVSADGRTDDGYKSLQGTSMAAPFVSFGAALAILKDRASKGPAGVEKTSEEITLEVKKAYDTNLNHRNVELPVFNLAKLVGGEVITAKIQLEDSSLATQVINDVKNVKMSLTVAPSSMQGEGSVEWFVGDDKLADGFEITFATPHAIGESIITAVWKREDGDDVRCLARIKVEGFQITSANISSIGLDASTASGKVEDFSNLQIGENYTFIPSCLEWLDDNYANSIKWYVDGEIKHIGNSYTFSPTKKGDYTIQFKVGDVMSEETSLQVSGVGTQVKNLITIISVCVAAGVGVVVLVVVLLILKKRR